MCVGKRKKGILTPPSLGEKPGTLVGHSIHRLNSGKMSKGVRDLQCDSKSSVSQKRHKIIFTFITQTSGCVIGVRIDFGFGYP